VVQPEPAEGGGDMTAANALTRFEGVYDTPESLVALDAHVAATVMGLRVFPSWNSRQGHEAKAADVVYPYAVYDRVSAKETAEGIRVYGTDYCDGTFWFPSRVIGHAWPLLERLIADPAYASCKVNVMSRYVGADGVRIWGCWVGLHIGEGEKERTFMETASSPALAICLAACKAVDA
jgi:hypothetical protein